MRSEHSALNTLLQSAAAIVMKKALVSPVVAISGNSQKKEGGTLVDTKSGASLGVSA